MALNEICNSCTIDSDLINFVIIGRCDLCNKEICERCLIWPYDLYSKLDIGISHREFFYKIFNKKLVCRSCGELVTNKLKYNLESILRRTFNNLGKGFRGVPAAKLIQIERNYAHHDNI